VVLQVEPCIGTNAGTDEKRRNVLDTTTETEREREREREKEPDYVAGTNTRKTSSK